MWSPADQPAPIEKPKKIKLPPEIVQKLAYHADCLEGMQAAYLTVFGYSESPLTKQLIKTKTFLRELADAAGYPNGTDQ